MSWTNSDGQYVKFGSEEGRIARGGEISINGDQHMYEFVVNWTDALSATPSLLGEASGTLTGPYGMMIPKGLMIDEVEVIAETAFTSSGTIGSATMVLGMLRDDRSTAYSTTALTTTAFVGDVFDATGEKTVLRVGSTGAGAFIGTVLANDGLVTVANSQHGSHPFTAGKLVVRVYGYFPAPTPGSV